MKDIKKYESSEPLDAGEWLNENANIRLYKGQTEYIELKYAATLLESFAQASITAKQKSWEEEKAELVNSLDWLYRNTTLLASSIKVKDLDESLLHAGKLIEKHTNE